MPRNQARKYARIVARNQARKYARKVERNQVKKYARKVARNQQRKYARIVARNLATRQESVQEKQHQTRQKVCKKGRYTVKNSVLISTLCLCQDNCLSFTHLHVLHSTCNATPFVLRNTPMCAPEHLVSKYAVFHSTQQCAQLHKAVLHSTHFCVFLHARMCSKALNNVSCCTHAVLRST